MAVSETQIFAAFIAPALIGFGLSFRCKSLAARRILRWNAGIFVPISVGFVVLDALCSGNSITGYQSCVGGGRIKTVANGVGGLLFLIHLLYIFIDAPILGTAGYFEMKHRWPNRPSVVYAPPIAGVVIFCVLCVLAWN